MLTKRLGIAGVAVLAAGILAAAPAAQARPPSPVRVHAPQQSATSRVSDGSFVLVDASAGAVVRARPRGRILGRLGGVTPLGTPTWLWALDVSRDAHWARVVLPWRPNGRTGWVMLAGRRVVRTRTWVQADVSRRRVMLMRGDDVVGSFLAAVGTQTSPTPTGRFSVTDPVATGDPSGPFGWYAFGLSGHQPHLPPGWAGGDQLAIHGTNDPASLGTAASAGCLRVSAAALRLLKNALRPGTPVVIHA
jgi:lipoprotein-anchoring transpeptidase ErfK/SrfK